MIDLLALSLGVKGVRSNGISRFAGTWTDAEHREFLASMPTFEKVDEEFWK